MISNLLELNDPVRITRIPTYHGEDTKKVSLLGEVAYLGGVSFAGGDDWVGVRLSGDSIGYGENNGSVNGKQYFAKECAPNGGLFVRHDELRLVNPDQLRIRWEKKCKIDKSNVEHELESTSPNKKRLNITITLTLNNSTEEEESIQASNIAGLAAGVDANDAGKSTKTVDEDDYSNKTKTKKRLSPRIIHDPPLGISVHALRHVLLPEMKQANFHETTIYDIEDLIRKKGDEITCPRDGIIGAAYVDCLDGVDNVGPSKRMLSYVWKDSIGDIIDSLEAYCESNNEDPKQMYIWICCLCNNLHRYNKYSQTRESKFQDTVVDIGHGLDKMFGKLTDVKYINLVKFLTSTKITTTKAPKDNNKSINIKPVKTDIRASTLNKNVKTPLQDYVLGMILAAVDECAEQSAFPKIDLEYAKLCDDVGRIMHQCGKYDEAIELYNNCLAAFEKVCGEDHVDTARSYSNIGSVMLYKCDYDKALDMFRKCLKVKEKIYGVEHYDTATTYNNIALVMMITSDYRGAMAMFEKALAVDEKLQGKEDPDTATSYNNIGVMKNKMGDLDGAILMYKKCLAVEEKFYGEEHHVTASSYNNIATALGEKCNYNEALEMHRKSLRVLVEKYGENHEDVIKTKSAIAEIKKTLG